MHFLQEVLLFQTERLLHLDTLYKYTTVSFPVEKYSLTYTGILHLPHLSRSLSLAGITFYSVDSFHQHEGSY